MILTTKSKYAVMAVVELAASDPNIPVKLAYISERQNISLNYLEQIFLKLKKANIVTSVKGPGGGYKLNEIASKVTIDQIIVAMDENLKMTRCAYDKTCPKDGVKCKTHNLWKGLSTTIHQYFATFSIADISEGRLVI
ncbi:MAG: Rrf2 family transcriptional regulator [Rickettsiaceae bacterium]|nr:Rrf2 family transcriptional regulator [Rickettsiaceae bacterium]